jgi:hypothetical protein
MGARRVRRRVCDMAAVVIGFAATAAQSVRHRKIVLLGALAALLMVAAVPILSFANLPKGAATSTLKCYDTVGNYESCATRTSATTSQPDGRTNVPHRLPGWITTALYQEATPAPGAVEQPANEATSAPAARRASAPRKHIASACSRRVIPCFFSALRRGVTHIASAAANLSQARSAREHL